MIIYTYQVAKYRKLQRHGIPLLDTTVKSGEPRLAPTWDMVMGHKRGTIDDVTYTRYYRAILDYWWFADPAFFDDLLSMPEVALGCYCRNGNFCHRYLLVNFLQEAANVDYRGELTS